MPAKVFPPTIPQKTLVAVPPIFILLATVILILRFWARKLKEQRWGVDDFFCLAALIANWICYALLTLATVWGGYGVDQNKIPPGNIPIVFKVLLAFSEFWGLGVTLVQLSILSLYLRIFNVIRWFRYTCYVLITFVVIWWVSWAIVMLVSCIPLEKYWRPKIPGKCIDMPKFLRWNLSSHIVLDALIIGTVLPVIWNMRTSMSNKLTVSAALGLAVFSTACAIVRFILVAHEWQRPNETGRRYMGSLFQCLEVAAGVICSSLPVLTFLVARIGEAGIGGSLRSLLSYVSRIGSSSGGSARSGSASGHGSDSGGGGDGESRTHLHEMSDQESSRPSQSSVQKPQQHA